MINNYDKMVGERIRESRKKKHMTMKELGLRMNLHESTVSRYEKGELSIDTKKATEFAKALEVTPQYLCGWSTKESIEKFNNTWEENVNEFNFTESEMTELCNFAKYLISKRGE